jgi:cystathionine beta-lyase
VISDEIHCSLTDPTVPSYVPFASVSDTCRDISVTCVSVSKTFNLAGLHASAVIVHDPFLRHKVWRGINTDEVGEPCAFAMSAAIAAYREGGEWLDALREYLYENKEYVRRFIAENLPRLSVTPSDATYLLWIDVSAYTDNSEEFAAKIRALTGLYVSDGVEYGHGGEGFLRLNTATQRANIVEGMERLKKAIEIIEKES